MPLHIVISILVSVDQHELVPVELNLGTHVEVPGGVVLRERGAVRFLFGLLYT